jgi:SAM-dependent methyltransferase
MLNFIRHPLAKGIVDLDDPITYGIHRKIIKSKPFLERIYFDFYKRLLVPFDDIPNQKIIEIGAGGFNVKEYYPTVITSDLHHTQWVDMAVNAEKMPFIDDELDGIILLHTLHHIPNPKAFISESSRCLRKGGYIVMIEPFFSVWGDFVYRHLHHEPVFDSLEWRLPKDKNGRLSNANGKMPFNIFIRDKKKFEKLYPEFELTNIDLHNCFSYLLSGGLSYKSLIPQKLGIVELMIEKAIKCAYPYLATSMTIVLEKKNE